MRFNSFIFAIFFPTVLSLYWLLPFRLQNYMLLAASYVFYGYWDWRFLSLLLISTVVDYITGLRIHDLRGRNDAMSARKMKLWLSLSICTNLGLLSAFKYYDFFADSMADLLGVFGISGDPFFLNVVLPVGISFYTFQTMSYTIDIYRGLMKPTRRIFDFALYVAFFPQLVAGPIERARRLLPRIQNRRTFDWSQFQEGLHLILLGYFKKVFVADNLAPVVDRIFSSPDPTGFEVLVGGWLFAFQVYGDFSGYSDIARGCGKCMGIELMVNFNHPYVAGNPIERWQRWHISLSSWLKDYLYIPLGGNRHGELKTYRNLGLTMLLGGLWHGAGWNFVLWGAWEGLLLMVHRLCRPWLEGLTFFKQTLPWYARRLFRMLVLFQLVSMGLVIFRGQSLAHIGHMLSNMLTMKGVADPSLMWPLLYYVAPLTLFELAQYAVSRDDWKRINLVPPWIRLPVYSLLFYLVAMHGAKAQSFIYFQF
jgi:D-alanyl-lipoteichoic acid acyltransferase DltB (MBOAT superfamily)